MRSLSIALLFLVPSIVSAQDCTSLDFPSAGGTVNCDTLTINSEINFAPNPSASEIEFIVSGNVVINASINISGQNGVHYVDDLNSPDIPGGPGASEGGGLLGAQGQSGSDFSSSDGTSHTHNGVCNHGGGGGGGSSTPGQNGKQCPIGPLPIGTGGIAFGFPSPFRGGFGGGAGGAFPAGGGLYDSGSGGGGGGGLHIVSTGGTITIKNGVRLTARGGRGGNSTSLGGAGGGGSGGNIWLESPFPLNNKGIIDVRGGEAGVNTKSSSPKGGNGGRGGDGIFRVEIAGVITDNSGLVNLSSPRNLESDISCGTIKTSEDDSFFIRQMFFAFILVILVSRILSRIPKRL